MGLLHIQAKRPYKFYKFPAHTSFTRALTHFEWSVTTRAPLNGCSSRITLHNGALFHFSKPFEENTNQKMAGRNQAGTNQTKDLKYATHLLSEKFRNMNEEKKIIVRELGFGGLMHIPPLRVHHQILRELANSFKLGENRLETSYGSFKIRPKIIGAALGINASGDLFRQKINYKDLSEDDKQIFRRFQSKTLKNLTDEMMAIGVDNEQDRLMFKRIFILYIQMAFLLPTTINKISPVHLALIFEMDTITERNWGGHVLSFIIKGITDYKLKKKKAIDGYLFALMIIYFHLSKNKDKKMAERPPEPWIANWTKEQLVERMSAKREEHMGIVKMAEAKKKNERNKAKRKKKEETKKTKKRKASSTSSSETETTESDHSTSEFETEEDLEDSTRKQHTRKAKKSEIGTEDLDEFLMENNEKSAAKGYEKEADLRSTEGHYVSSEIMVFFVNNMYSIMFRIPDVNLGSDDPSSQGHTEQSSINKLAESVLSLVEESASEPAEENMMVMREETPSEGLAIFPIQVCLPLSQTTTMPENEQTPETENEPTPLLQIEGTTKSTPESPQQLKESTHTLPPAPSKINPAPEDVAALMLMARTASYIPKIDSMPSFSLGLTDSSQEETATQEGASTQDGGRAKTPETPKLLEQLGDLVQKIASGEVSTKEKSPQIPKESGAGSFEKFETLARTNQNSSEMKEKYYLWAIRVKTYADGRSNEFDNVRRLQAQDIYTLSKVHLASLARETHIEAEIVFAMCFILNQQKIKRFQEENMAIANHPKGVFLQPKNNKPFRVEDYPMFIPFLDLKKLALHRYIFAPVCHSQHWWLWLADTRKRKFYIVDPYYTKSPSDERTSLNTFIVSWVICWGAPLKTRDKDKEIEPPYLNISGQEASYDCAIYVMKWLEILQPANIKRRKYECENWTQDEVDHFRVEYASRILFHDMNLDKAEAIRGSNAIRLSKPSSLLLSPYCQMDSKDIDTD
ncbi:hypothetical protein Ahy_B04g071723 [Arachis hypogaea]|uniref:Ubiquitin-like protease family profile domain-containing protein n=1 Tax=Arachis hypogaea TaxID=3818 RepID=A0A444ZLE0_ARAHY|nr:hypothetical protein Ahy_B04g071723 [Arachis hypogaea]